jgi:hypothetical protein
MAGCTEFKIQQNHYETQTYFNQNVFPFARPLRAMENESEKYGKSDINGIV